MSNIGWKNFVSFQAKVLLSARSSQIHATSFSSLMSHHRVNNKYNRVKGQHWKWLAYTLCNFLLRNNMLRVFRSNHHCSWELHEFHRKTPVLESLFFLKIVKLYKDICSAWISRSSVDIFSNRLTSETPQIYNRSIVILRRRTLIWTLVSYHLSEGGLKKTQCWQKEGTTLFEFLGGIE